MNRIHNILIVFLVLLAVGCTRNEILPGAESAPVYQVSGTMDGESFVVTAGQNGVELIPTYDQTDYGVMN